MEAVAAAVAGAVTDCNAQLIVTMSATGTAPDMVSKYKPPVPQVRALCSSAGAATSTWVTVHQFLYLDYVLIKLGTVCVLTQHGTM